LLSLIEINHKTIIIIIIIIIITTVFTFVFAVIVVANVVVVVFVIVFVFVVVVIDHYTIIAARERTTKLHSLSSLQIRKRNIMIAKFNLVVIITVQLVHRCTSPLKVQSSLFTSYYINYSIFSRPVFHIKRVSFEY